MNESGVIWEHAVNVALRNLKARNKWSEAKDWTRKAESIYQALKITLKNNKKKIEKPPDPFSQHSCWRCAVNTCLSQVNQSKQRARINADPWKRRVTNLYAIIRHQANRERDTTKDIESDSMATIPMRP